jgi:hypothetical protein
MSRAWRIEYEWAYYHMMSRGNEGGDIFLNKADRRAFLDTIGELFGITCSAVSHAVKTLKTRMNNNPELKRKFNRLNSQFKL